MTCNASNYANLMFFKIANLRSADVSDVYTINITFPWLLLPCTIASEDNFQRNLFGVIKLAYSRMSWVLLSKGTNSRNNNETNYFVVRSTDIFHI